ncbi:MAG: site-specific DNA-methyltransferase [Butyrivibrio sp.]|nr:site-specific DNA-methyltransferase [Muribaculum sp.]MCM1553080.1 site-specific DNA-methyltransferase [Butyrivibrio sp.]
MLAVNEYINNTTKATPFFIQGDALNVLADLPKDCIDCVITSPPYYMKRQYLGGGIGLENTYQQYIDNLLAIIEEVYRILKPTGSFWLNIGDSYKNKQLLNIPYRVAIRMQDEQKWILRNTVVWDKMKGAMSQSKDSLGCEYEPLFHFVKKRSGYYYDSDSVRKKPRSAHVENGAVVSATGVSGVRYRRKIELSTELTEEQRTNAYQALDEVLERIKKGELSDFRMVIKGGNQRVTNGDTTNLSGRAKELRDKGFYFLFYNPNGSMISDVWQIIPEDTQGRKLHFAPFPEDLVKTPIVLTCPPNGIVLDPFVGTGTTSYVATQLGRRSIGIDMAKEYLELAEDRCSEYGCVSNKELETIL